MTEHDVQLVRTVRALRIAARERRAGRLYATAWSLDLLVLLASAAVLAVR